MDKPIWKKFKFQVTVATILLEIIVALLGEKLTPEYLTLMRYILGIAIALIGGHTITDSVNALKKK